MTHNITLPPTVFEVLKNHIITKHDPLYATGDTLNITLEGQREQRVFTILSIETAHVFAGWCLLGLEEVGG